jgi:hypothetical protein
MHLVVGGGFGIFRNRSLMLGSLEIHNKCSFVGKLSKETFWRHHSLYWRIIEWTIVCIFFRHFLWLTVNPDYIFLMYFIRCQLTVTVTLILVLGPKVSQVRTGLADKHCFTHVNDQHTKLKRITSCIPCTHHFCLTTFVHGFIWIMKLDNSSDHLLTYSYMRDLDRSP